MNVTLNKTLNPGKIAEPAAWLIDAVETAQRLGFPYTSLVVMDDPLATELLNRNNNNRPLRDRRSMRYRHDMERGLWRANGEPIVVTSEGRMISGQHRCFAVAGTSLEVPMFVAIGVEPECADTVDQGAPKNAGDYLAIHGEDNAATLAKITRLRLAYEANDREAIKDTATPTNADVLDYFEHHREDIKQSAALAVSLREHTRPIAAPSIIGFAHNVLHDIDATAADSYIEHVAKGEDIKEGQPAFAVRTRLLSMGKTGAAKKAEVIFTGWNAERSGRQLRTIRVSGRLPRVA